MHRGKDDNGASRLAWEMFEKTGNISYYMLYHELKAMPDHHRLDR